MCDSFVYMKTKYNEIFKRIIMILQLSNMLNLAKNQFDVNTCKNQLKSEVKMKYLNNAKNILEIILYKYMGNMTLWLNQVKYVQHVLDKFNMYDSKRV